MNTSNPASSLPIDRLRARLQRLATDPRIRLVPEGRAIAFELVALLTEFDELKRRVAAIERGLASYLQSEKEFDS